MLLSRKNIAIEKRKKTEKRITINDTSESLQMCIKVSHIERLSEVIIHQRESSKESFRMQLKHILTE